LTPHSSPEKLVFSPSTKFPPAFWSDSVSLQYSS
jgi:hypothetical protein